MIDLPDWSVVALGAAFIVIYGTYQLRYGDGFQRATSAWAYLIAWVVLVATCAWGSRDAIRLGLRLYRRWRRPPSQLVVPPPRPTAYSREPIPPRLRFAVLQRDGFRCAYCGRGQSDGITIHLDHLVPVALGGKTELENLVVSCSDCNLGKSASDLIGTH